MFRTITLSLLLSLSAAPTIAADLYECSFKPNNTFRGLELAFTHDRQAGRVTVAASSLPKDKQAIRPRLRSDRPSERSFQWSYPVLANDNISTTVQVTVLINPKTMAAKLVTQPTGSFRLADNIRRWTGTCKTSVVAAAKVKTGA